MLAILIFLFEKFAELNLDFELHFGDGCHVKDICCLIRTTNVILELYLFALSLHYLLSFYSKKMHDVMKVYNHIKVMHGKDK